MKDSVQNFVKAHRLLFMLSGGPLLAAVILCYLFLARPALLKTRYKLAYQQEILAAAAEFQVDPYLVSAVIYCESGYRAAAVSSAGAVGLMQLMPATAKEAAEELGMEGYSEESLKEPSVNIRLGTYYLAKLLKDFDNTAVALAAYNAGPGRAREWLRTYGTDTDGSILYIPYPETDKYVDKVQNACRVYQKLYPSLGNGGE